MKIEYCSEKCNYRGREARFCGYCLKGILEETEKEKEKKKEGKENGADGKRRDKDAE